MTSSIFGFALGRRYQIATPLEHVLEMLAGPLGATLMLLAATAGILLLLAGGHRNSHFKNAAGLIAVAFFLLIARMLARTSGVPLPYPALSVDILSAQMLGMVAIGLPCLIVGAIAGGYLGGYLVQSSRAALEAACCDCERLYFGTGLDLFLALTFCCFGFFPTLGAAMAGLAGLMNGMSSAVERELGVEILPKRRAALQFARVAFAVALMSWVIADGRTSFFG